ncbi:MAG TPA: molybdopterin-dependent oxidoreductase, partial [Terracidiphilus sp.]|nr:molybdopterin-dependent oxidoreductase [Terracidiphilus sp.]
TSGSYRYRTRPWEMNHVSTVCTHCADGCKVTLGVRQSSDGAEIIRADNRDKSGINNDFLCAKGRFGFDFVEDQQRLTTPLARNAEGRLEPTTWDRALRLAGEKLKEIRDTQGGDAIGVIGCSQMTNEEIYLLQKFTRTVLRTNNIDHERSASYSAFASAIAGHEGIAAGLRETESAPAILLIGGDPTYEHPLLAWKLRFNVRLNKARLYIANSRSIKLERQARAVLRLPADGYSSLVDYVGGNSSVHDAAFREALLAEESLLVILGPEFRTDELARLIKWGIGRGGVKFALLGDYVNSRGAADMGLLPDRLPGYVPVSSPEDFAAEYPGMPAHPGKTLPEMIAAAADKPISALLVAGSNPAARPDVDRAALKNAFVIVQDMFLTETAELADIVLPTASLYEKAGTVTNTYGDIQLVRKAADRPGVKPDFEIIVRLAGAMGVDVKTLVPFGRSGVTADLGQSRGAQAGEADRHAVWLAARGLEPRLSPFDPLAVLDEIERLVPSYKLNRLSLLGGNDVLTEPGFVPVSAVAASVQVTSMHDGLFTSGTLGRYSVSLKELEEHQESFAAETTGD